MNRKEKRKQLHWEIYQYYLSYLMDHGKPPLLEEIGKKFNFTRQRAHQVIIAMEREGYIVKTDKPTRTYYPIISRELFNQRSSINQLK